MNIDLTPIFQAAIALLGAIITYRVIPWIKAKTTNEQQTYLRATIKSLVYAAEQMYGAGAGAMKMEYVVKELEKKGFTVDVAEIEAAVSEYLNTMEVVGNVNLDEETPDE